MNEIETIQVADWTLKIRTPAGPGPHPVIIMLHGWTGDEDSMWIFSQRLPTNALLIAPRAPYEISSEQYNGHSWVEVRSGKWSWLDDFRPAIAALNELIAELEHQLPGDFSKFDMVGFSQGAAMANSYTILNPGRVGKLAGLAGFVPEGCEEAAATQPLEDVNVFIAHGTQDQIVPLERAKHAVKLMQMAGAKVHYCESESAHKLGSNCFRALKIFFE
ncbi:MAG: hypothetical protein N2C13_00470 [Chloroflexota bacterium]